jgi:hypothetical protein
LKHRANKCEEDVWSEKERNVRREGRENLG